MKIGHLPKIIKYGLASAILLVSVAFLACYVPNTQASDELSVDYAQCWPNRYFKKIYLKVGADSIFAPSAVIEVVGYGKLTYKNHKDQYQGEWEVDACPCNLTVTMTNRDYTVSADTDVDDYATYRVCP